MENYKPNSNRFKESQRAAEVAEAKEREKRVDKPVVTGNVRQKKPSAFSKVAGEFISEDAKNVKSYVWGEVLIPAIKKLISDIVTDGIGILLYGESRHSGKRTNADRVSYRSYYDRDSRPRDSRPSIAPGFTYDDIILDSRGEAEDVLDRMYELLDTYQIVRVADLYDLVGISTNNYTINKYGWTNLRNAEVVRVRDGYMIKLPRAIPIE